MKHLKLIRTSNRDEGAFGVVSIDGALLHSLELPWRENLRQKSCIPAGAYLCRKVLSPKFGLVYGVLQVEGRSHILMHSANFAGDTSKGFTSQLLGCIAFGEAVGRLRNPAGVMQRALLLSRPAMTRLEVWAGGQDFELEIVWN